MRTSWMFACVVLLFTAASASAQTTSLPAGDTSGSGWPNFAGPNFNCTSDEKGLLKEWPKGGPKVLWRVPIEKGWNHPSAAGEDLVFAETKRGTPYGEDQTESIVCLDAATGKQKWKFSYNCPFYTSFQGGGAGWQDGGVQATPVITDKYVVSVGLVGETYCLDRKTGKEVWKINLRDFSPRFAAKVYVEWKGNSLSPLVVGGIIPYLITHRHENLPPGQRTDVTMIIGFKVDTGKIAWQIDLPLRSDVIPLPIKYDNEECILLSIGAEWKIIRMTDGKQVYIWKNSAPVYNFRPIPAGKNLYLDLLDNAVPAELVECDFSKENPTPKILWRNKGESLPFNYSPPTVQNGCFFGFKYDSREDSWQIADQLDRHTVSLRCHDLKDGALLWKQPGFRHGLSIAAADGMLYVRDHQTLRLVEANPKQYIERGRVENLHNLDNRRFSPGLGDWVMPVIFNGRLYIRTPLEMICYDISAK